VVPGPTVPGTPRPLAGRRVVITRSRDQAGDLGRALGDLGAEVVELPVIAIEDPPDGGAALAGAAGRLAAGGYEWVVVTSANAVTRLLAALGGRALPGSLRWAAVGPSTARALGEGGIVPDLLPEIAVSDALIEAFPPTGAAQGPRGREGAEGTVLYVRAETTREIVGPGLVAKGWQVDEAVGYRTVAGRVDGAALDAATGADAVAFTSPSTVEHTVSLLGAAAVPPVVATIGPVTSEAVRSAGLRVSAEAGEHTLGGLVGALVAALGPPAAATTVVPGQGPLPST